MEPTDPMMIDTYSSSLTTPTSTIIISKSSLKEKKLTNYIKIEYFPLEYLIPELILQIISFLEARELLNLSQTCRLFYEIYQFHSNYLWKIISERKWKFISSLKNVNWKKYYYQKIYLSKEGSFCWTSMDNLIKERPIPRMCHTGLSININSNNSLNNNHQSNAIIYIGGQNGQTNRFNDIYLFDGLKFIHQNPLLNSINKPPFFARHTSVVIGEKIYSFGGFDGIENYFGLALLDLKTMEWSCPQTNGEENVRVSSFTIPFVFDHFIFFYGGQSIEDGSETDDLVSFDTISLTWQRHKPKENKNNPKQRSVGTINMIGSYAYLFAGSDSFDLTNSVHKLYHPIFSI